MSRLQLIGDAAATFHIEGLPSVNELIEISSKGVQARAEYVATLRYAGKMIGLNWRNSPFGRPLGPSLVYFGVWRPNRIRRDVHNLLVKPLLDGFVDAGIWPDDNDQYICSVTMEYLGVRHPGGVEIEIHEIDEELLTDRLRPRYTEV